MEGAGETEETGAVAEVGVGKGAADQVGGVGGDVASLVVSVESEVEAEEIVEALVLLASLAEELGEVVRPILRTVELLGANLVDFVRAEDQCGDTGDLCEQRDAVVESWLPVIGLVDTVGVGPGKFGLGVQCRYGNGQLGHWVHILREGLDKVQDVFWEVGFLGQFAREGPDLGGGGDLAGEEQPEHGFWQHLGSRGSLGELLLAVLDGLAVEADTLIGIQDGAFPHHGLEASHSSEGAGDCDIANYIITTGLDLLEKFPLGWDGFLERSLQFGLGRCI